ncbi:Importin-beta, N-terminal domain-containing protein [Trypanosoma grayi]|uniref:Importin-beta, N-terminal domain-containing protein n=1 Tax=Trypanosoma grayi TaxID=71804 RepID=UPI0004F47FE7|nr:Importin-beta, N-terminal domain-containing protein [Trypanosoma grayi]KEG10319.1 Importin-beta, N-terminal domain-containing protein [Trypanosoma grayi]
MINRLVTVEGVEQFSALLYNGDKAALQVATEFGWMGMASAMGPVLMQNVMQQSSSQYSIFFVSQALRHLVDSHLGPEDLVALEVFLSSVIVQRHASLSSLSVDALTRLLCAVVKQGFCDAPELQGFPAKVTAALVAESGDFSDEHISLSCSILVCLIDEMENAGNVVRSIATHKRVITSFRNDCLLLVFRAASHCLQRLHRTHDRANYSVVLLIQRVLQFDFACSMDEATEDVMTREYPQEWANDLIDQGLFSRLWELYSATGSDPQFYRAVLETLTPLVSLKPSLYLSQEQHTGWMVSILSATLSIMESRLHLEEASVLRGFCRLLNRVKPNFTIEELRKAPCYERWVREVAEFTKLCFHNWRHARQAFLSLTSIWAKLVGSQSYCKNGHTLFEVLAPDVCISYILSNQEQAVRFVMEGETAWFEEYILDIDAEAVSMEFDFASQLLRFCGEKAEEYLLQEVCSSLALLEAPEAMTASQLSCMCERLACIVRFAGSWLSAYRYSRNARTLDSAVLRACVDVVQRSCQFSFTRSVPQAICRHFHKSLLTFLRVAWQIILLDRVDEARKLRESIRISLSLANQDALGQFLLRLVVDEVMECVHCCTDDAAIEALGLLSEMAQSPSTAAFLKALPQFDDRLVLDVGKVRASEDIAVFYRVRYHLSRIRAQVHFMCSGSESSWSDRVLPLVGELQKNLKEGMIPVDIRCDPLTAVVCSWRGVFHACVGQNEYKVLLRHISPSLPLLTQELQRRSGTVCGVQILRLIHEITENRYRRVNFGPNGVEGYHLFRYVCGSMDAAVHLVMGALESGDLRLEEWGIKCLRIMLRTGRNILTGGYCNLGVLRLYEDPALMTCLASLWQAIMVVDRTRLCHYEKLAQAYLTLLGDLFKDFHLWFLSEVPTTNLLHIIQLLESSLGYYISNAIPLVSLTVEALGAFTSILCHTEGEDARCCELIRASLLQGDQGIISRLLRLMLDVIVSKKCSSSVTETPLRNLIALDENSFAQLATVFAGFAAVTGKEAEVRAAFALLASSAGDFVHKGNNNLFAKEFQYFSTIITSCLC